MEFLLRTLFIGVGATIIMDLWLLLIRKMGVATLNMAFFGRWIGHLQKGTLVHENIGNASTIEGELLIGWCAHYAIGIGFAGLLLNIYGLDWARSPSLLPALLIGILTVLAPLLILQPAMGAGFASLKTATPLLNCFKSLVTHTVYGLGLYLSALLC